MLSAITRLFFRIMIKEHVIFFHSACLKLYITNATNTINGIRLKQIQKVGIVLINFMMADIMFFCRINTQELKIAKKAVHSKIQLQKMILSSFYKIIYIFQ